MTGPPDVLSPDTLPDDWAERLTDARDDHVEDYRRFYLLGWCYLRFPRDVRSYRTAARKLDDPKSLPPVRWAGCVAHSVNRLSATAARLERLLAHRRPDGLVVPVALVERPANGEAVTGLTAIGRPVWAEVARSLGVPSDDAPVSQAGPVIGAGECRVTMPG